VKSVFVASPLSMQQYNSLFGYKLITNIGHTYPLLYGRLICVLGIHFTSVTLIFKLDFGTVQTVEYCCMLSGEATNTDFTVFGLTRSGLEPTIYRT
jgi:hypothetical protein